MILPELRFITLEVCTIVQTSNVLIQYVTLKLIWNAAFSAYFGNCIIKVSNLLIYVCMCVCIIYWLNVTVI